MAAIDRWFLGCLIVMFLMIACLQAFAMWSEHTLKQEAIEHGYMQVYDVSENRLVWVKPEKEAKE